MSERPASTPTEPTAPQPRNSVLLLADEPTAMRQLAGLWSEVHAGDPTQRLVVVHRGQRVATLPATATQVALGARGWFDEANLSTPGRRLVESLSKHDGAAAEIERTRLIVAPDSLAAGAAGQVRGQPITVLPWTQMSRLLRVRHLAMLLEQTSSRGSRRPASAALVAEAAELLATPRPAGGVEPELLDALGAALGRALAALSAQGGFDEIVGLRDDLARLPRAMRDDHGIDAILRSSAISLGSPATAEDAPAAAAAFAAADRARRQRRPADAVRMVTLGLRLVFNGELHTDSERSPLIDDPAGHLAPWRESAFADYLRTTLAGREAPAVPAASDPPPTVAARGAEAAGSTAREDTVPVGLRLRDGAPADGLTGEVPPGGEGPKPADEPEPESHGDTRDPTADPVADSAETDDPAPIRAAVDGAEGVEGDSAEGGSPVPLHAGAGADAWSPGDAATPAAGPTVLVLRGAYGDFAGPVIDLLRQSGHDPRVVSGTELGPLLTRHTITEAFVAEWLRLVDPSTWATLPRDESAGRAVRRLADCLGGVDVVFADWCDPAAALASLLVPPETRLVIRVHRVDAMRVWHQFVDFSAVAEVIFVAEHVRAAFLGQITQPGRSAPVATRVLNNVIDVDRYRLPKRPGAHRRLALVGWGRRVKDPIFALEVLAELLRHEDDWELHLIGRDFGEPTAVPVREYADRFRTRATSPDLRDHIRWVGFTGKLESALQDCGFALSTSVVEGWPVGVVEAGASGAVPVIRDWTQVAATSGAAAIYAATPDWVIGTPAEAARRIRSFSAQETWRAESARVRSAATELCRVGDTAQEYLRAILGPDPAQLLRT